MSHHDDVIIEQYVRFDTPADEIISDPHLSEQFQREVNAQLQPESHFTLAALNKRILNLRKRGEDNGGLPRLRRSFHGRTS